MNIETKNYLQEVKSNLSLNKVLIAFGFIILCIVAFNQCEAKKTALATNDALTSELESYKLKNGNLVASNKIAIMQKKQLLENVIEKDAALKEMAKKFSSVTAVQKVKAKTTIPKIAIAFEEPITTKDIDSTDNVLRFERDGSVFNEWYNLGYTVTQDSLTIEPFATWTDINRVDGFKRKWFLGKKTYHSDITFTNPYINTDEVHTYQVAIPVKWYESRLFNIGVGFIGGYLLAK